MVDASSGMKVLIADAFSKVGEAMLKDAGFEVSQQPSLAADSLKEAMANMKPAVLVVRSTKVTPDIIDANPDLKVIVRAGAGYDTIDVAHCKSKQVMVANCPGKNANAVSELTMGLILAIDRRIVEGASMLKEGKWNKGMFAKCKGIKGRKLGVIGFGNIGQLVCKAAKAMEMEVVVQSRTPKPEIAAALGVTEVSLDELLSSSDIVSIHTPSTAETKGMVNDDFCGKMKSDAVLINTSRGNVVVDDAVHAKLEANSDFWLGTDVFNGEPSAKECDFTHKLSQHPRVYGTHHCGASTAQAEFAIGMEAVRIIEKFNSENVMDNWVNKW